MYNLKNLTADSTLDEILNETAKICEYKLNNNRVIPQQEKCDVIQEVLITMYKNLDKFDHTKGKMSGFAECVARTQIINYTNKLLRNSKYIDTDIDVSSQAMIDEHRSVEVNSINILDSFFKSIECSDIEKEIILLRYNGFSYSDIAKKLKKHYVWVRRILDQIKKKVIQSPHYDVLFTV